MSGKLIVIEGPDGSGKTTLAKAIRDRLIEQGVVPEDIILTREPGGSAIGESLRALLLDSTHDISPLVEAYMFTASRLSHVETVIKPALGAGKYVICDRFIDSTWVYQCIKVRDSSHSIFTGVEEIIDILKQSEVQIWRRGAWPAMFVFLSVDTEVCSQRLTTTRSGFDRMEETTQHLLHELAAGYKERIAVRQQPRQQGHKTLVLDGTVSPADNAVTIVSAL